MSTANGEMIFGMNLVFGQRERKEIGARTKRAMEEMALERIHPSKAPYGYIRNKETGHLEVEPIEAEVVKEIFELCKQGNSTRGIATIMKDNNVYLKQGKWKFDRVYKILTNSIYIGVFECGKYKRKPQDILRVENYCEPIIDEVTLNATRNVLVKNKHSNYEEYIHLFSGLVKCPICGEIMSSSESFKYPNGKQKVYYHLRCKNHNCSGFGLHYNTEKIETKLKQVLEELTLFMLYMDNEIITCNSIKSDDVKDIEKAIEKLKLQEKRLVDLYLEKDENYGRLGRYGILRLHFIAQNKQALYETLLMTNKLTYHLLLVSDSCENYYKELMENYIKNDERLSEKSKELNPLE